MIEELEHMDVAYGPDTKKDGNYRVSSIMLQEAGYYPNYAGSSIISDMIEQDHISNNLSNLKSDYSSSTPKNGILPTISN